MKNRNMIFDFTQCYPKRKEPGLEWHDCSAIGGSRLYCSRDAEEKIKALIAPAGVSGIHFIDSGDYHYISKIMTDFIKEPFTLVLIDHHTDMQDASLGGDILSCGNWAKKVLQENPYLQRLVLIGQEKKALDKLQSGARQQETDGKLVEISYEELKNGKAHEKIKELPDEVPVYISIDKDVLDEKYAVTNWDQGKMSMGMLEQILKTLVTEYDVIGVDICGMYPEENSLPEYLRAERVNIRSDEELYRFLQKNLFCWLHINRGVHIFLQRLKVFFLYDWDNSINI